MKKTALGLIVAGFLALMAMAIVQPSPCVGLDPNTNWFLWWWYDCNDYPAGGGGSGAGGM